MNHADRLNQIADDGADLWRCPSLCDDLRAAAKHIEAQDKIIERDGEAIVALQDVEHEYVAHIEQLEAENERLLRAVNAADERIERLEGRAS